MDKIFYIFVLLNVLYLTNAQEKYSPWEVKCYVCKATVQEMVNNVSHVDPKKMVDVGSFRLDATGNSVHKRVQYSKSDVYLTELMQEICGKMDEYAKVRDKKTRKLSVIKLIIDGKMNSAVSEVDFIQDEDLNKSLKHYCLEVLEENDDVFLEAFKNDELPEDLDVKICSEKTKYCKDEPPIQEEYKLEDEEQFKEEL